MYHGTPAERAELRRTVMRLDESQGNAGDDGTKPSSLRKMKTSRKSAATLRKKAPADKKTEKLSQTKVRRSGTSSRKADIEEDDDQDEDDIEDEDTGSDDEYKDEESSDTHETAADAEYDVPMADGTTFAPSAPTAPPSSESSDTEAEMSTFPVVITTYEMIIKDRIHLAHYDWGYIVVDEGHRLKNLDCKLMQEIKKYPSAGRMILTGTPLHVSFISTFIHSCCLMNNSHRTTSLNFGHCSILSCRIYSGTWMLFKSGLSYLHSKYLDTVTYFLLILGSTWAQCNVTCLRKAHRN